MAWLAGLLIAGVGIAAAITVLIEEPIAALAALAPIVLIGVLRNPRATAMLTILVALFFPATVALGLPIESITLVMLVSGVLAACGLAQRAMARTSRVHFAAGGVLVLAACIAIAAVATGSEFAATLIALRPYLFAFFVAWYLTNEARVDPEGFRRVLILVAWGAAAVSLLALLQRATGTWPVLDDLARGVQYTSRAYGGRPGGTMGHPIIFGAVATLGALLAVTQRGRFWIVAATVCAVGVLASGSRSSFAALGIGLLVYTLSRSRQRIFSAKGVMAAFLAAAVAAPFLLTSAAVTRFIDDLARRLQLSGDISAGARDLRADIALSRIFASPETALVGHGALADSAYLTEFGIGDGQATTFDNMYVAILHNSGLLGLVPLLIILIALLIRGDAESRTTVIAFATLLFFVDMTNWPALITIGTIGAALTPARGKARRETVVAPTPVAVNRQPARAL